MSGFREMASTAAFDSAIGGGAPVIVKFQTESCVICRKVEPMLAAVARRLDGKLAVVNVDAEKIPELAARFGIRGLPTLILFKDGEEVGRRAGFVTAAALRGWVAPHIDGGDAQ